MYLFINNRIFFEIVIKDLIYNGKQDVLESFPDGSN